MKTTRSHNASVNNQLSMVELIYKTDEGIY